MHNKCVQSSHDAPSANLPEADMALLSLRSIVPSNQGFLLA